MGKKRLTNKKKRSSKKQARSSKDIQQRSKDALIRGVRYHQAGNLQQAEEIYRQILKEDSGHPEVLYLLGLIALQNGDTETSVDLISKAIESDASVPRYHKDLGEALRSQGKIDAAIECYQQALRLKPDLADAHNNLGNALKDRGRLNEAIESYQKALDLKPKAAEIHSNLGNALRDRGRLDEAIECCQKALDLKPDFAEAYNNLGNCFENQGRANEAIECYQKALDLKPGFAAVYDNLGSTLKDQGRIKEAIESYRKALDLKPDFAEAYNNLGSALKDQGKLEEALKEYRRAVEIKTDYARAHSNLLFGLHYHAFMDSSQVFMEHRGWAEQHALQLAATMQPHLNGHSPDRPLRIGYVSPDFRRHSVAFFVEPLLAAHDRSMFEVICYSDVVQPDAVTKRLQDLADEWHSIFGMSDEEVSHMVRKDRIDILVDLAGHTANNRMLLFARKPAPIQVTYLGYPNTTGLSTVDYRITDSLADPSGQTDHLYTEELVRLPHSFLCYQLPSDSTKLTGLPAMEKGWVTFGSFNNRSKVTPEVVEVWAKILSAIPNARLIMKSGVLADSETRQVLQDMFVKNGISPERIDLLGMLSFTEHLQLYNRVDIGLDTFPYNGTTTTCEALWMGVPVVVLAGQTHVSRVGVSLLSNVGLQELIAESTEDYVEKAVQLASDLDKLTDLRANLRSRMADSPLMDAKGFTRSLEKAYRQMWYQWCSKYSDSRRGVREDRARRTTVVQMQTENELTQRIEKCLSVTINGDIKVCLPKSIDLMTPYILLEQEDWFEDEIEFIRHLLKPGMQVIDIGANYGVYTLTMAKIIGPTGRVWAFEPASTTAAFLNQSIKLNLMNNILLTQAGLSNRKGTAKLKIEQNSELNYITNHPDSDTTCETIQLLSIDDCEMEFRWNDIDFIKLDAEGEESNIVKGGAHFLSSQSPLIMFELKHGNKVNLQLIKQFAEIGYGTYRYVNGLNLLAPFALGEALDPYQLNLFCCKTDRARLLEDQGLLSSSLSSESSLPDTDGTAWQSYINVMPYGHKLMLNWKSLCQSSSLPGWKQYQTGLNYYVAAHVENESPQVRYTSLRQAQIELNKAIKILPNFSRLQTLARVLLELGLRGSALETINLLLSMFHSHQQLNMNEPFMPVSSKFDFIDPADQIGRWCLASILEQREKSQAFSSYFTGNATIENLERLRSLGFQAPEMERRRQLIKMRFGLQNCPELSPVLKNRSADNLNPSFWKGELVSEEAITINQQGEDLFNAGHIEEALTAFNKAIETEPELVVAHNNLGVLYWHLGDADRAIKCFNKALKVDPLNQNAITNLTEVLESLKQASEATQPSPSNLEIVPQNMIIPDTNKTKPAIRVLHNTGRAGGTVICKCLGCMKDVVLLSEIHPLGAQQFNPIHQAREWFNLLTTTDIEWLQKKGKIPFEDAIGLIYERCSEKNKSLIIRDWSYLDFTAIPFVKKPSYRLSTSEILSSEFTVKNTAIVRHPIDQWLSLRNVPLVHGKITLEEFLKGYLRFAEYCKDIGFVRYEDFTRSPEKETQRLCERLSINYDPTFIEKWWEYTTITGDTNSQRGHKKEIKPVPRREMEEGLLEQFERNPDYIKSIEILGYAHPQKTDGVSEKASPKEKQDKKIPEDIVRANRVFVEFLKENKKIWDSFSPSPTELEDKVILVDCLVDFPTYILGNLIISKYLQKRTNAKIIGLVRDPSQLERQRHLLASFSVEEVICVHQDIKFDYKLNIDALIQEKDVKKLRKGILDFSIDGLKVGDLLYDAYLRDTGLPTISCVDETLKLYFHQAMKYYVVYSTIFKKHNVIATVQGHTVYLLYGMLARVAVKNGVVVFGRKPGSSPLTIRKYSELSEFPCCEFGFRREDYDFVCRNNKEKAIDFAKKFLSDRFEGRRTPGTDPYVPQAFDLETIKYRHEDLYRRLNVDPQKPTVFLMCHALSDSPHRDGWSIHNDYYEWLEDTLDIVSNIAHVNWVVKPHPMDKHFACKRDYAAAIAERYSEKYKHIKLCPEDLNTLSVLGIAKAIVTVRGTAALEFSAMGIPSVVTGSSAFTSLGFSIEPTTREEYVATLKNIHNYASLSQEKIEKALICCCFYFYLIRVDCAFLPNIPPVWWVDIDAEKFWGKALAAVKNRAIKDDPLYRNFNIQIHHDLPNLMKSEELADYGLCGMEQLGT